MILSQLLILLPFEASGGPHYPNYCQNYLLPNYYYKGPSKLLTAFNSFPSPKSQSFRHLFKNKHGQAFHSRVLLLILTHVLVSFLSLGGDIVTKAIYGKSYRQINTGPIPRLRNTNQTPWFLCAFCFAICLVLLVFCFCLFVLIFFLLFILREGLSETETIKSGAGRWRDLGEVGGGQNMIKIYFMKNILINFYFQ